METSVEPASSVDRAIVQRVLSSGVKAASVVDLATIAFSRREEDVPLGEANTRRMLQKLRNLRGLIEASRNEIAADTGLDDFEVLRCQALMELGRRGVAAGKAEKDVIDCPRDVLDRLDHLRYEKKEHFVAILLDAKAKIIRVAQIHVGTLTMSVVGAREVFREAINDGAASIVVAHNHPSGDPTPSPEDIEVTHRLVEVGELLDIPVIDHVIIGENAYRSLNEMGLMKPTKR